LDSSCTAEMPGKWNGPEGASIMLEVGECKLLPEDHSSWGARFKVGCAGGVLNIGFYSDNACTNQINTFDGSSLAAFETISTTTCNHMAYSGSQILHKLGLQTSGIHVKGDCAACQYETTMPPPVRLDLRNKATSQSTTGQINKQITTSLP